MKIGFCVIMCAMAICVTAQHSTQGQFGYVPEQQEYADDPTPNTSLFYIPVEGAADLFTTMSAYNFSAMRYMRRGYDLRYTKQYVNGIDLWDPVASISDFTLVSAVRRMRPAESYKEGLSSDYSGVGGLCGVFDRSVRARDAALGSRATVSLSDRRYRYGLSLLSNGVSRDEQWAYSLSGSAKIGRDPHVKGLFAEDWGLSVAADRKFSDKQAVSLYGSVESTNRGLRSATLMETFNLTGNNLYNPSWGYFNDKIRSSRVASSVLPFFLVTYDALPHERTLVTVSTSYRFGRRSRSGLSWQNAATPYPDYYRYLPSSYANPLLEAYAREQWRSGNSDVTQVNWGQMVWANSLSNSDALYIVDNSVEDVSNLQLAVTARTKLRGGIEFSYGARYRSDASHNYKRVGDMLQSDGFVDDGGFMTNEDAYGNTLKSDMRNPYRRVGEGDIYGYNYRLFVNEWSVFARTAYRHKRFRAGFAAEFGDVSCWRSGEYEKEFMTNVSSYGPSSRKTFSRYNIKWEAGYSISPRHNIDATMMYATQAPDIGDIFYLPQYSNDAVYRPDALSLTAAEINYNATLPSAKFKLSAFTTTIKGQSSIYRYYDDILSASSHLLLSQIETHYYGIEAAGDINIMHGLTLSMAGSLATYGYTSDARADIWTDLDRKQRVEGSRARLKGYNIGGTPQSLFSADVRYSGSYGWLATLSVNYMADSFVNINPIRRMDRTTIGAGSPERLDELTRQERLPTATTVNLFMLKSLKIKSSDIYVIASVNNLLNNRNIVYSGYEQMRLKRLSTDGSYAPFPSKYLFSYGRTFYLAVNYKF